MKLFLNKYRNTILQILIFVLVLSLLVGMGVFVVLSDKKDKENDAKYYQSTVQYALIDLGATTCDPCVRLQPELKTLRDKYSETIDVKFFDMVKTQEGASYATAYGVQTMPTLIFLDKYGREQKRIIGFHTAEEIEQIFLELGWINDK